MLVVGGTGFRQNTQTCWSAVESVNPVVRNFWLFINKPREFDRIKRHLVRNSHYQ